MDKQNFENGMTDKKWWQKIHFDALHILCIVIMIVCGAIWIPTYVHIMSSYSTLAPSWLWWLIFIGATIFILAFIYLLLDIGSQVFRRVREHKNGAGAANNEMHNESKPESVFLRDFLLTEDKDDLLERIKSKISTRHSGLDLARLFLALREENLLASCKKTKFHELLVNEFPDLDLPGVRILQDCIKSLTTKTYRGQINDIGEEKKELDEWRAYLNGRPM